MYLHGLLHLFATLSNTDCGICTKVARYFSFWTTNSCRTLQARSVFVNRMKEFGCRAANRPSPLCDVQNACSRFSWDHNYSWGICSCHSFWVVGKCGWERFSDWLILRRNLSLAWQKWIYSFKHYCTLSFLIWALLPWISMVLFLVYCTRWDENQVSKHKMKYFFISTIPCGLRVDGYGSKSGLKWKWDKISPDRAPWNVAFHL